MGVVEGAPLPDFRWEESVNLAASNPVHPPVPRCYHDEGRCRATVRGSSCHFVRCAARKFWQAWAVEQARCANYAKETNGARDEKWAR